MVRMYTAAGGVSRSASERVVIALRLLVVHASIPRPLGLADRQGVGQRQRVSHVRAAHAALLHVLFALELDLVAQVVAVLDAGQVGLEILVVWQADALLDRLAKVGPHLGAHVGVTLLRRLAAKVDLDHIMSQLAQAIHHRAADAATVDHDGVGVLLVGDARHLGCQRHAVHLLVNVNALALRVAPLPQVDHAAVIAEPGDVHAHDQWLTGTDEHLEIDAPLDIASADKLQRSSVREHATHAHLEEVAVLAVVLFHWVNSSLLVCSTSRLSMKRRMKLLRKRPAMFW